MCFKVDKETKMIDAEFVNQLFGSKRNLLGDLSTSGKNELPVRITKHGEVLGSLLVLLKDKAGLKYKDINEISVFSNLSFSSLRSLYRRTKMANRDIGPCA